MIDSGMCCFWFTDFVKILYEPIVKIRGSFVLYSEFIFGVNISCVEFTKVDCVLRFK